MARHSASSRPPRSEKQKHFAAGRRPGSVALADVNADRAIDILVASLDDGMLTVWLGDGRREFRARPERRAVQAEAD